MTLAATVPAPTTLRVGRCEHTQKKSWTFSDGVEIALCPDCRKFDKDRRSILNPRELPEWHCPDGYELKYRRRGTDRHGNPCYEHRIRKEGGPWCSLPLALIAAAGDGLDVLIASALEAAKPIRPAKQPPDNWADVPTMAAVLTRHANINWRTNTSTVPCFDEHGAFAGRLTLKDAETELERDGLSGEYDDHGKLIRCYPARPYFVATNWGMRELYKLYDRLGIDSFWRVRTFETTYPDVRWNPDGDMKVRRPLFQHLSVNGSPVPLRRVSDNL